MELLNNYDKTKNHSKKIVKMTENSDEVLIASPFLSDDIESMLSGINNEKHIRKIVLVTVLKAFDESLRKADILYNFIIYCELNKIVYEIHIDEKLHGKIYLFYKNGIEKGVVISSANFTTPGLINNHEWGVTFDDQKRQKYIFETLISNSGNFLLTKEQIENLKNEADKFKASHPKKKEEPKFDATKVLNMKPSKFSTDVKYFIKPVGSKEEHYDKHVPLGRDLYFSKRRPSGVHKNDILICYAVGSCHILGYYQNCSDKPIEVENPDGKRWPWYVDCDCLSRPFSDNWWEKELYINSLDKEYIKLHPDRAITHTGGKTLGGLQWGSDKIQLDAEFARYLLDAIEKAK